MTTEEKKDDRECGKGTCLYHSGLEVQAREFGRRLSDQRSDRDQIWTAIKDKVPIRYFILLTMFVVGGLGFQLLIYDSIKAVDKKIAVIEYAISARDVREGVSGK